MTTHSTYHLGTLDFCLQILADYHKLTHNGIGRSERQLTTQYQIPNLRERLMQVTSFTTT